MTDENAPESPVSADRAPDHGPQFWASLQQEMHRLPGPTSLVEPTLEPTATIPRTVVPAYDAPARSMPRWPLAAAAALLLVFGIGFFVLRGNGDPATTTEIVGAPNDVESDAGDGSDGDEGQADDVGSVPLVDDAVADSTAETETDGSTETEAGDGGPATSGSAEAGDGEPTTSGSAEAGDGESTSGAAGDGGEDSSTSGVAGDGTDDSDEGSGAQDVPPIPDFADAAGASGEPAFLPLDQGLPADATYLANWPERGLTWYAVSDPDATCADPRFSEIRYVNASGITQPIRDPQLRYSGEISHFVVRNAQNVAGWIVACGEQLELHIATLEPTGRIGVPQLVWLGEGSASSALVLWGADEVSVNAIAPDGAVFSVDYNLETKLLSRNGGPSRIMLEAGAPADRSLTPLAASPDGGLTYWQGSAERGTVSACSELLGSGQSDMIWLRQGEGQWRHAVPTDVPVGTITAAALDSASLQIAFADVCPGESGRVIVGTQLADGRIGDVTMIDMAPYVPGYVAQIFWVDDQTLRLETDNTQFGFGVVRFDYRLDQGVVVQLD